MAFLCNAENIVRLFDTRTETMSSIQTQNTSVLHLAFKILTWDHTDIYILLGDHHSDQC